MHVIIGSGALASATGAALARAGVPTRTVSRRGLAAAPGIEARAVDASDADSLARALDGASVVHQCAQPPYPAWADEFPTLQRGVLAAADRVGADVVLCDNLYGYGRAAQPITERSPVRPASRKGALRASMVAEAREWSDRTGRRLAVLQPSNYFGPGYDRFGEDVFRAANRGREMRFLGSLDQPHSFSYLPDVGHAMAALGTSPAGWGSTWIAPTVPPLTQRELGSTIWEAAGHRSTPRMSVLSRTATRVIGAFSPLVRELTEMMYEFEEPFVVDSSRIASELGVHATTLDRAVAETLAAYPASR